MSSPSIMQRLGNTASKYAKGMKSLAPGEDEAAGIKATQQNVNEATQPPATPPARIGGTEMLHPGAKYGSRPGEKRLDSQGNIIPVMDEGGDVGIDAGRKASAQGDATVQSLLDSPDEVTAPVNQGTAAPAAADFSGMAKLGQGIADMKRPADNATAPQYMQPTNAQLYPNAPVAPQNAVIPGYDTGGDVALNGVSGNAPTKLPIGGKAPEKKATGGVSGNAPTTLPVGGKTMRDSHDVTPTITPSAPLPTYDKGGPVDVNDGQHQLAILKHGEKVLNPKEADAYRAGQQAAVQMAPPAAAGAPADFPGRVMANPDNVQPVADTDIQPEVDQIDPSAQMSTQNAPLETPQGDISNTPGVDVNAKQKPAAPDPHVAQAAANEYGQGEQPPEEPEVKGTEAERKAIEVDKQKAMGQGIPGLVPLGLAKIHENQLSAQPKHLPAMEGEPKVFDEGGDVKGVPAGLTEEPIRWGTPVKQDTPVKNLIEGLPEGATVRPIKRAAAPSTTSIEGLPEGAVIGPRLPNAPVGMVSPSRYSYTPTMAAPTPRPSVSFQDGRYPVMHNVNTGLEDSAAGRSYGPRSDAVMGQELAHGDYLPPVPALPVPKELQGTPTYDEGGDVALTPEQLATVKAHELQTQANMVVPGKAASDQSVSQPIARVGMPQMAAPTEVKQPSRMPAPAAAEPAPQVKPTSPGMPQMTAQAAPTMATPTYGGPGKAVPQGQMIPEKQLPQDEFKAKMAAYDTQIQAALDTATPEGKEQADRLALAKQNFQHKNPYGSEGNHPGFLGKMAHIGAKIGNIAGGVLAPKTMELIPGTDLNKMQQGANLQAQLGKDVASEAAAAKETKALAPQDQLINAGTALQAAKDSKDPAAIQKAQQSYDNIVASFNAKDATAKTLTPEEQLVDANKALQAAQASGDPTALKTAQDSVKAITDAINAKTGAAAVPATPEQVAEYGNRVKQLGLTPEQEKVYGSVPAGSTVAEIDKHYNEAAALKGQGDKEAQTTVSNRERDDAAAAKKVEESGHVFDKYSTQVDKVKDPMDATGARAGLAIKNLDLKTKAADALVAPEILTLAAGGQGSGLRMNEAEISRIVGGRDIWDTLKSKINYLQTKGGTFDDTQRGQLRQIAQYVQERSGAVSSILDQTREKMLAGQGDETAVRTAYDAGKKVVSQIEQKGIIPDGSTDKAEVGMFLMHNGALYKVTSVDKDGKNPQGSPVKIGE